jgi:hypothetical protein
MLSPPSTILGGGKEWRRLPVRETFCEGRDDVHIVARNASHTVPAKCLVFFVKDKSAPILVPTK